MPGRATQTRSVDVIRFADGTEIVADTIEPTGKTETAGEKAAGFMARRLPILWSAAMAMM